jgi:iron(III) transport system permease protein
MPCPPDARNAPRPTGPGFVPVASLPVPLRGRPVQNRARKPTTRRNPLAPALVLGAGVVALLLFVGYPLLWLVLGMFGFPRAPGVEGLLRSFTQPANLQPLANTVMLALSVGIMAVLIGVPLAWLVARTDMPLRRFVHSLVGLAYVLPPYLAAIAYIILLGPNAGYVNRLLGWALGVAPGTLNIFTFGGVALVITLHVFAFPYYLTHEALHSVDGALEEAARILQASRWYVLRRVTLPLVAPAITGGALLAAVDSMALFGPQALLGMPAQITFLPTRIFSAVSGYPQRFAEASTLSMVLVVLTVLGLSVQRRFLDRRAYVTIGGKGGRAARWPLGRMRWPAAAAAVALVAITSLAPVAVLVAASFSKVWTDPPIPGNLTLDHFREALLDNQIAARGVANSLMLAAGAATLVVAIGLTVAYLDLRTRLRGRRVLEALAALPLGLPGTVLAVAMILAFLRPPLHLYGTIWILLAAYVARAVPLATRGVNGALRQVDVSLEEAARITGASWLGAICRVLLPILRPSLLTAWLLVFIPALSELSATILLYTSGTETISVAIYRLNDLGQIEVVAALSVVLIAVILCLLLALQLLSGRGRQTEVA